MLLKKNKLLTGAILTGIEIDIPTILSELDESGIKLISSVEAGRGATHQYVHAYFLRGSNRHFIFEKGIDSSLDPDLEKLPALKSFLLQIPAKVGRVALLELDRKSVIPVHVDSDNAGYFASTFRFHVPFITNDEVFFFNGGHFYQMKVGEVWTINNLIRHGVVNNSNEKRLHLVFDAFISEELVETIENGQNDLGISYTEKKDLMMQVRERNGEHRAARLADRKKSLKKTADSKLGPTELKEKYNMKIESDVKE